MTRCVRMPFLLLLLLLLLLFLTAGVTHAEDVELAQLFSDRHVDGTIYIASLDGKTEYVHNDVRAEERFLPASTFKIPNTLIALDEGVITDENEIIKWDGVERDWDVWNKDHSLTTALPVSCVWFYQELASRVGDDTYLRHLDKIEYGNMKTGSAVTTFWLEGDLSISAREQVTFLKKLYNNELPYKAEHVAALKKIMIVGSGEGYAIHAKTGWVLREENQYGWFVGYVDTGVDAWFFAINIDINEKSDAVYRQEIAMKALELKKIIPSQKGEEMSEEIRIVERVEQHALYISECVGTLKLGKVMGPAYQEIMDLREKNNIECGEGDIPFTVYENVDWEQCQKKGPFAFIKMLFFYKWQLKIGIPSPESVRAEGRMETMKLAAGKYVRALHVGPYMKVGETYTKLQAFATEKDIQLKNSSIEFYLNDPRSVDAAELRTEVLIPIAE